MWKGAEKCAFSEFCRDSTKKNEFFSVFAAPKFGSMEISSYFCKLKGNTFLPLK